MSKREIWIDINAVERLGLSIHEYLFLLSMFYKTTAARIPELVGAGQISESLLEKGYIKIFGDRLVLPSHAKKLINDMNSKKGIGEIEKEFVEEYRKKFKGLKPGAMGSFSACRAKLLRWKTNNPEYTNEEILKATDAYIRSVNDFKYLKRADYFIFKREGGVEESNLSAFIDELDDLPTLGDEWTSTLN